MDQNKLATIIIVSRQSRRRESLRSILKTLPQVEAVYGTHDPHTAQNLVEYYQPAVALLDGELSAEEADGFLNRAKSSSPQTRWILLSNLHETGGEPGRQGVDRVLFAGYPAFQLLETVQTLLVSRG